MISLVVDADFLQYMHGLEIEITDLRFADDFGSVPRSIDSNASAVQLFRL